VEGAEDLQPPRYLEIQKIVRDVRKTEYGVLVRTKKTEVYMENKRKRKRKKRPSRGSS